MILHQCSGLRSVNGAWQNPAQGCTSRLEPLKAAGRPVDWHVYPGATRCCDCRNLDRFRKIDFLQRTLDTQR